MRIEETRKMVDTAIEDLANALERGQSDKLRAYLAAMGRFHRYSLGNAILIALARPGATRVAGFRTWQKLGRQVCKGEHGIAILAPIRRRRSPRSETNASRNPDEASLQALQKAEQAVVGFRTAHVFDVSQTDGRELPEFAAVQGEPGELLLRLQDLVRTKGLTLQHAAYLNGAEGLCAGKMIVVRTGLSQAEEFSTLTHEMAHAMLHQDGTERTEVVKETEAEAVAYVVCVAAGLETNSASSDYVLLYDGKKETLMASLERIRHAAVEIIGAVLPEKCHGDAVVRNPGGDATGRTEGVPSEMSVPGKAAA